MAFLWLDNPLKSLKSVEGDRYAFGILEALKEVAVVFGEQVIVLQYFANITKAVSVEICLHNS